MGTCLPPPRRYRGVSREDRRSERRELLLCAAIRVYGEAGYRNATVKAVCAAAALTERYFYESFANSEALLIAAYDKVNRMLIAEIGSAQSAPAMGTRGRAEAGLRHYFASLRRDPTLARLFLMELPGVSRSADQAHRRALGTFAGLLADTLDPSRLIAAEARDLLSRGVVGAIFGIALHWIGSDYAQPLEAVVAAALRISLVLEQAAPD